MKDIITDENGIQCPHCGHWNTHEECGTYTMWFPRCVKCEECTEIPPDSGE
jgi:hypothetical protein